MRGVLACLLTCECVWMYLSESVCCVLQFRLLNQYIDFYSTEKTFIPLEATRAPQFLISYSQYTRWCSWLRHCATNRKVADSISDGVIIFFIDIILPDALWLWSWLSLSQILAPGIFPGGKGGRCIGLTTTFMCRLSWNLGASTSWKPQGLSRPEWDCFTFTTSMGEIKPEVLGAIVVVTRLQRNT